MDGKNNILENQTLLRNKNTDSLTQTESESLHHYLKSATSDNTRKAYRSAIRQFEKWGGRLPTNQDNLVKYLLDRSTKVNPRTLDLHLTAIKQWHQTQGFTDPVETSLIRKTMEGIRRVHGKPKQKAKALRLEHIAIMIDHLHQLPDNKKKYRDIALILTAYFGAFRRSELVSIKVEDLKWETEGLIIQLPHSKTDQEREGINRALPFGDQNVCPATAIKKWLTLSNITDGVLFRPVNRWDQIQSRSLNPNAINELLKLLGSDCQFDFAPQLSSHSFRRGLSTSAARAGVDFELIKKQGGWKSDATVWQYIEEAQQLNQNASIVLMEKMAQLIKNNAL